MFYDDVPCPQIVRMNAEDHNSENLGNHEEVFFLPADRADERRIPISENLRNLREAFLLPGFSQVNSQCSKVNHHGEFSSGAGTRPAGLRQNLN
jgi:hypothetical protein